MVEPLSLSFREFTAMLLGIQMFRYFTALLFIRLCLSFEMRSPAAIWKQPRC